MLYRHACLDCSIKKGKIVFMRVVKNGVTVRFGYYAGYHIADLWECPECGKKMLSGWSAENFDPDFKPDYDFSEG